MKIPLLKRLKTKILISMLAGLVLIISALTIVLYNRSHNMIVKNTADTALRAAKSLSQSIDAQAFKSLKTVDDENTEAYQKIRKTLNSSLGITGSKYIYTMRKTEDGSFVYVVDGSKEDEMSHLGDAEETTPEYEAVWNGNPYEGNKIEQTEWGMLISSYYPITDQGGAIIGFVGVDYDASQEYASIMALEKIAIAIPLFGVIISIGLGLLLANYITKPIKGATAFANALVCGNLNYEITNKPNDELGQLLDILDRDVRQVFIANEQARQLYEKQARYQSEEAEKVLSSLGTLAQGELTCDLVVSPSDQDTEELHAIYSGIAENLIHAVRTIGGYIRELDHVLDQFAQGDLTERITSEFRGDFATLKRSIDQISQNMSTTMAEILKASEQVASGTRQVSDGSQMISQGATEQAGAIEQLSATITSISSQTRQNALNANTANELANTAKRDAEDGNNQMLSLLRAMVEINDSSENIFKIIKVIDDIAFQTNILALNAAVEAARAGIHGKGFAVVAEEVRNLAQKSADAAKETAALIEGTIKKVEAGSMIADQTALALGNIVQSVEKAAGLVSEIAVSSRDQALGIAQVNQGIEQLSTVVQTNSATAEEAAATSEELSGQAELLSNMVGQFKLRDDRAARLVDDRQTGKMEQQRAGTSKLTLNDSEFGKY